MDRCILCGRKITNHNYSFGLGCLKKMCTYTDIKGVKNLKGEDLLNRKILKICNKKSLLKEQKEMLTDRYLTLSLLNEVPLECYDNYRNLIQNDINSISRANVIMNMPSCDVITLKQANEINKYYKKYKTTFHKIMDGDYDMVQNISFELVRFAFSRYYNNKPYLSDMNQMLQFFIFRVLGVGSLRLGQCKFSADCLEYSLNKEPKDVIFTEGYIIDEIKENSQFKGKIEEIIQEHKNKKSFKVTSSIEFEDIDLKLSLQNITLKVEGQKKKDNKWNLKIFITLLSCKKLKNT